MGRLTEQFSEIEIYNLAHIPHACIMPTGKIQIRFSLDLIFTQTTRPHAYFLQVSIILRKYSNNRENRQILFILSIASRIPSPDFLNTLYSEYFNNYYSI